MSDGVETGNRKSRGHGIGMTRPPRREFRPPPPAKDDGVLNYSNPRVEKEIARKWRRHRLRELSYKAGLVATFALLIGAWLMLRLVFGITICIIPIPR